LNTGASAEEAVKILEDIVEESEKTTVFNYHLGMAYLKQGDKAGASQYLLKVIEYSGDDTALADQAKKGLLQVVQ
jgi:predicted Zn-dependent protease